MLRMSRTLRLGQASFSVPDAVRGATHEGIFAKLRLSGRSEVTYSPKQL